MLCIGGALAIEPRLGPSAVELRGPPAIELLGPPKPKALRLGDVAENCGAGRTWAEPDFDT